MKSIILFLIPMFIIFSCVAPTGFGDDDNGDLKFKYSYCYKFTAKIEVSTESGEPCNSACVFFIFQYFYPENHFIYPVYISKGNEFEYPPAWVAKPCTVYMDRSNLNIYWTGEVPFYHDISPLHPSFKVVFPDSLVL